MTLERPTCFGDLSAWWVPAVGEDVARHVVPEGIDVQRRLYVECSSRAWATQVQVMEEALLARLNRRLAQERQFNGLVAGFPSR
ncbi:DciA family protein [Streptomyces netropsis]|uniref:DciA family protein n=1 Tax=Streptomyces netropsis TaxID=55404 RepID=UPI0037BC49FE